MVLVFIIVGMIFSLVPLGLGLKPHRFPFITIALIGVCVFKFYGSDKSVHIKVQASRVAEIKKLLSHSAFQKLKLDHCLNTIQQQIVCEDFFSTQKPSKDKKQKDYFDLGLMMQLMSIETDIVEYFLKDKKNKELEKLASFSEANKIYQGIKFKTQETNIKSGYLTKHNQTPQTYLNAIFSHADEMHLFGNMLVLGAFGIFVEAKVGALVMLATYLFSGIFSSLIFVNFFAPENLPLMGASGCIAGSMGMFYVYFHRHYLKFMILFRTFLVPVKKYFPLFYIITDVATHIQGTSNVAAMAHLSAMAFGVAFAYFVPLSTNTPYPFIYRDEYRFFKSIKEKDLTAPDLNSIQYWLSRNPINFIFREKIIKSLWDQANSRNEIKKHDLALLAVNTQNLIGRSLYYQRNKTILKVLKLIPNDQRLSQFLPNFSLTELTKIYNLAIKKDESILAIRLAFVLMEKAPDHQMTQKLIVGLTQSQFNYEELDLVKKFSNQCLNAIVRKKINIELAKIYSIKQEAA